MDCFKTEQAIEKIIKYSMNSASLSSKCAGDSIEIYLEHIIDDMTGGKIKTLWGPMWSVFLASLTYKIQPDIDKDTAVSIVKEVLLKMVGNSNATPFSVLAEKTDLTINDIERSMYITDFMTDPSIDIATKACSALHIPTPEEVMYLYVALGKTACPREAAELASLNPVEYKPISKDDIPAMHGLMDAKREYENAAIEAEKISKQIKKLTKRYHKSLENMFLANIKQTQELNKWNRKGK